MSDTKNIALQASTVERIVQYFQENGGLTFMAYYERHGAIPCTICDKWEVLGATISESEFSFTAKVQNQPMIEFTVRKPESIESVSRWFEEASNRTMAKTKNIESPKKETIPTSIVFQAIVGDHSKKFQRQTVAA